MYLKSTLGYLTNNNKIITVAIETLGPLADEAQHFLTEIGRRATRCTADPREAAFLHQRISVAIQRFNAVCPANSLTISESHGNHSGHRHYTLLISKSLGNEVPWAKKILIILTIIGLI